MESYHYRKIKSGLAYVERLLLDMEDALAGKQHTFSRTRNNLTDEQALAAKAEIKKLHALLKKAKETFNLEHDEYALSHVIDVDSSYIWETLEDLWSHKVEKSSGKIHSLEQKEQLDKIIRQLYERTTELQNIVEK